MHPGAKVSTDNMSSFTVPESTIKRLCREVVDEAMPDNPQYDLSQVNSWNSTIIRSLVDALREATERTPERQFKIIVNSTISEPAPSVSSSMNGGSRERGIHAATGCYWDTETDGMFTYRLNGGVRGSYDVIINIVWLSTGKPFGGLPTRK